MFLTNVFRCLPVIKPTGKILFQDESKKDMLICLCDRDTPFQEIDSENQSQSVYVCVGRVDSAQDASSHVSTVAQPVLYKFDVFQVVFDDADQVT